MIVLMHVMIALLGIISSTHAFFRPSNIGLRISYMLIASTLISGTYLVVSTHSPLLQACTSGLVYSAVVSLGIIPARKKLAVKYNQQ